MCFTYSLFLWVLFTSSFSKQQIIRIQMMILVHPDKLVTTWNLINQKHHDKDTKIFCMIKSDTPAITKSASNAQLV